MTVSTPAQGVTRSLPRPLSRLLPSIILRAVAPHRRASLSTSCLTATPTATPPGPATPPRRPCSRTQSVGSLPGSRTGCILRWNLHIASALYPPPLASTTAQCLPRPVSTCSPSPGVSSPLTTIHIILPHPTERPVSSPTTKIHQDFLAMGRASALLALSPFSS